MLISRGIKVGDTIEFDYDDPRQACKNGIHRTGTLHRMYRAKKTKKNDGYLMYVIIDDNSGFNYRQFRYRNMRNIKINPFKVRTPHTP